MTSDRTFIGRQIGNYRITAEIGSGGFARVYRGEHLLLKERTVAIKFLHTYLSSPEEKARFLQEASMLETLRHHYILLIYDVGIDEGFPYLVAEYAPNGSLRDRLKQSAPHPLPIEAVIRILSQIGQALHVAHQQHIIHRDLKPENILFNREGEALLADFGIATIVTSASLRSAHITGTPSYMAPEQFAGTVCKESDQYALGCIGYELVTGRPPFTADNVFATGFRHLHETPPPPSHFNPQVPASIEYAILTAMAKDRTQRFPDLRAFISALYGATSSHSSSTLGMTRGVQTQAAWQQNPGNATYPALPLSSHPNSTWESTLTSTPSRDYPQVFPAPQLEPVTLPPELRAGVFSTPSGMAMNVPMERQKKHSPRRNVLILGLVCLLVIASVLGGLAAFAVFPGTSHSGITGTQRAQDGSGVSSNVTATSPSHQQGKPGARPTPTTQALHVNGTQGATTIATATMAPKPTATFTPTPTPTPVSESLVVYFTNPNGTQTQHSYQGTVTVSVSGSGQASQTQWSDAFYRYTGTTGTPTTSPGHPSCWVLWINNEDSTNFTALPGYSTGHGYTFTMNAPGGTINFKVCDSDYSDNTGEYSITITQN